MEELVIKNINDLTHKNEITGLEKIPVSGRDYITLSQLLENQRIEVSLASNQTNDADSLVGAIVTLTVGGETESVEWNKEPIWFSVIGGSDYSISVSEVERYKTPTNITGTATANNARNVTMTYETERVFINVSTSDNSVIDSCRVKVNNINYLFEGEEIEVRIPFGTEYTIVPEDVNSYTKPGTEEFTASTVIREVDLEYTAVIQQPASTDPAPMSLVEYGVFVKTRTGGMISADNWQSYFDSQDASVCIVTESIELNIYPQTLNPASISGTPTEITLTPKVSYSTSNLSFTEAIEGWYVPSGAELWLIWNNKDEVNRCLSCVGGNVIGDYTEYWSSTSASETEFWSLSGGIFSAKLPTETCNVILVSQS